MSGEREKGKKKNVCAICCDYSKGHFSLEYGDETILENGGEYEHGIVYLVGLIDGYSCGDEEDTLVPS